MKSLNKLVLGGALVLGMSGCGSDLEGKTNSNGVKTNFTEIYNSDDRVTLKRYSGTEAVVDLENDGEADFMINSTKKNISCAREGLNIKEYNHYGDKYSSDKETQIVSRAYQEEFNDLLNQNSEEINLERLYKTAEPKRENKKESELDNSSGIYKETHKNIYIVELNKPEIIIDLEGDGQVDIILNKKLKKGILGRREGLPIKSYELEGKDYLLSDNSGIFSPAEQYNLDRVIKKSKMKNFEDTRNLWNILNSNELESEYFNIKIKGKSFIPTNKTVVGSKGGDNYIIDINGDGNADFVINYRRGLGGRSEGFFIKEFIMDGRSFFNKKDIKTYKASINTEVWTERMQRYWNKALINGRPEFW